MNDHLQVYACFELDGCDAPNIVQAAVRAAPQSGNDWIQDDDRADRDIGLRLDRHVVHVVQVNNIERSRAMELNLSTCMGMTLLLALLMLVWAIDAGKVGPKE